MLSALLFGVLATVLILVALSFFDIDDDGDPYDNF